MKKLLFIFAVLGLTLISCKKEEFAPSTSSTSSTPGEDPSNGGDGDGSDDDDDGGDNGGVASPRDTFLIESDITYGLIDNIVLIKAVYDNDVLMDEDSLTIDIGDIEKMYDGNEFSEHGVTYNDISRINIISYWWEDDYEFSGGNINGIKIGENTENFEQIEYYVQIHLKESNTYTPNTHNNNFFKIRNGKLEFFGDNVSVDGKVITFKRARSNNKTLVF